MAEAPVTGSSRSGRQKLLALPCCVALLGAGVLCAGLVPSLFAQAQSPAKSAAGHPLEAAVPSASAQVPASPPKPAQQAARTAVVTYVDGKLLVVADNSGLNSTLRAISRAAGIKLTGSAGEDRVYGTYGPASPASVLSDLIDGSGSNMLFVQGAGAQQSELILTPRTGGASPPSSSSDSSQNDSQSPMPQSSRPVSPFQPQLLQGNPSGGPNSYGAPGSNPPAAGTNPPAAGGGDPNQPPPNGVRTPQQIYEQLQRMREGQPPSTPQ